MEPTPQISLAFAGTVSRGEFDRIQSMLLPKWARWYVFYPALAAVFCAFSLPGAKLSDLLVDLVIVVLFPLAMLGVTRRARSRAWRQMQRLGGAVQGVITSEGIEWNTVNTASAFAWSKIVRVAQADGMTLAFYTPRCAFYFPRSFFASESAWSEFNGAIAGYAEC